MENIGFDGNKAAKDIYEIEKQLLKQAEAIADTLGLQSVLILGTYKVDRKTVSKVVGFDGSLYELVHIANEFVGDFQGGDFTVEHKVPTGR